MNLDEIEAQQDANLARCDQRPSAAAAQDKAEANDTSKQAAAEQKEEDPLNVDLFTQQADELETFIEQQWSKGNQMAEEKLY